MSFFLTAFGNSKCSTSDFTGKCSLGASEREDAQSPPPSLTCLVLRLHQHPLVSEAPRAVQGLPAPEAGSCGQSEAPLASSPDSRHRRPRTQPTPGPCTGSPSLTTHRRAAERDSQQPAPSWLSAGSQRRSQQPGAADSSSRTGPPPPSHKVRGSRALLQPPEDWARPASRVSNLFWVSLHPQSSWQHWVINELLSRVGHGEEVSGDSGAFTKGSCQLPDLTQAIH